MFVLINTDSFKPRYVERIGAFVTVTTQNLFQAMEFNSKHEALEYLKGNPELAEDYIAFPKGWLFVEK